jgi:hypothetical protein
MPIGPRPRDFSRAAQASSMLGFWQATAPRRRSMAPATIATPAAVLCPQAPIRSGSTSGLVWR